MSVFINSFPIGITLALLSLGWLADNLGWPAAFHATAVLALAALLLVALVYQRHPNDDKTGQTEQPDWRISRQEDSTGRYLSLRQGLAALASWRCRFAYRSFEAL